MGLLWHFLKIQQVLHCSCFPLVRRHGTAVMFLMVNHPFESFTKMIIHQQNDDDVCFSNMKYRSRPRKNSSLNIGSIRLGDHDKGYIVQFGRLDHIIQPDSCAGSWHTDLFFLFFLIYQSLILLRLLPWSNSAHFENLCLPWNEHRKSTSRW